MSQQATDARLHALAAGSLRRTARVSLAVIASMLAIVAMRFVTLIEGPDDPFRLSLWMWASVMLAGATATALACVLLTPSRGLVRMGWLWWLIAASPIPSKCTS